MTVQSAIGADAAKAASMSSYGRGRVATGMVVTTGSFAASQVIRLTANLTLAHLLAPRAFGLMALVNVVLAGLQMFSDIGIGPSIIQNERGTTRRYLDTAYSIQAIRGLVLFGIAALAAWPISVFYEEPALALLIPVASASALLSGLNSTSIWTLTREVRQGKLALLKLVSDLAGLMVALTWAFIEPTVWALVGGLLTTTLVGVVGSHLLEPHRSRFAWDPEAARSVITFGGAILLSTATWFLASQAETLIFGKMVPIEVVGVVALSAYLAMAPGQAARQLGSRVMLPWLSEASRRGVEPATAAFRNARKVTLGLSVLTAVVLTLFGPWLAATLLPEKFADAQWIIPILAVRCVTQISQTAASQMLIANARLRYNPIGNTLRLVWILVGLPVALIYGDLYAAIWVLGLSGLPSLAVVHYGLWRQNRSAAKWDASATLVTAALQGAALFVVLY